MRIFIKITCKVPLQYLFNVFILFNTISYFKLNIYSKMRTFKTLDKTCQKHLATLNKVKKCLNQIHEEKFMSTR